MDRPSWLNDRSYDDPQQHWHQPLLPHEERQQSAASAAGMRRLGRRLRAIGKWVATAFASWARRARTRRALAELSDYELRDIGLTRTEALGEASKPFWWD